MPRGLAPWGRMRVCSTLSSALCCPALVCFLMPCSSFSLFLWGMCKDTCSAGATAGNVLQGRTATDPGTSVPYDSSMPYCVLHKLMASDY